MEIKFKHDGKSYLVKKTALFIFHKVIAGRNTPSKLFVCEMADNSNIASFIEEIENRKAQRLSALRGTFRLNPDM